MRRVGSVGALAAITACGAIVELPDGEPVTESSTAASDGGAFDSGTTGAASTTATSTGCLAPPCDETGTAASTTNATATDAGSSGDPCDGGCIPDVPDTGGGAGFPEPQPFGDSVHETDLVGTWSLPADGSAPGYSMMLEIAGDGSFSWTERDDACAAVRSGTGVLWVEFPQIVALFDAWDDEAPWDVEAHLGFSVVAPFLVRFGYAPVGGQLGLSGPPPLRVAMPWQSRGYARIDAGAGAAGTWVSEVELWAIPPGSGDATILVRDRYTVVLAPGQDAQITAQQWWYDDGVQSGGTPQPSGAAWSDDGLGNAWIGGAPYAYLNASMLTMAVGDRFNVYATPPCG
jgi:hypothetical protein